MLKRKAPNSQFQVVEPQVKVLESQNKLNSLLYNYALNGEAQKVEELLFLGAEKNMTNPEGYTPLFVAAYQGGAAVVRVLLKARADVDRAMTDGATALFAAAQDGRAEIVKLLLDAGAKVDLSVLKKGETVLHVAAQNGHTGVVKMLIEAVPPGQTRLKYINETTEGGCTALYFASFGGHAAVVDLLLSYDVDKNKPNNDGATPLYVAAEKGYLKVIEILLRGRAAVDQLNKKGFSPIFAAVQCEHDDCVELFLKAGASLGSGGSAGYTPLHVAAESGYQTIVKKLIESVPEEKKRDYINLATSVGTTALYLAACGGHALAVTVLLHHGADPNKARIDEYGGAAPLHTAAYKGHWTVVSILLRAGAMVDRLAEDGVTPLHLAAQGGHMKSLQLLLEARANPNTLTGNGITALMVAVSQDRCEVVKILLDYGASPNLGRTPSGSAVLHIAARRNLVSVTHWLIEKSANIAAQDADGITALTTSVFAGNREVAEILLKAGADWSELKSYVFTALLDRAQFFRETGRAGMFTTTSVRAEPPISPSDLDTAHGMALPESPTAAEKAPASPGSAEVGRSGPADSTRTPKRKCKKRKRLGDAMGAAKGDEQVLPAMSTPSVEQEGSGEAPSVAAASALPSSMSITVQAVSPDSPTALASQVADEATRSVAAAPAVSEDEVSLDTKKKQPGARQEDQRSNKTGVMVKSSSHFSDIHRFFRKPSVLQSVKQPLTWLRKTIVSSDKRILLIEYAPGGGDHYLLFPDDTLSQQGCPISDFTKMRLIFGGNVKKLTQPEELFLIFGDGGVVDTLKATHELRTSVSEDRIICVSATSDPSDRTGRLLIAALYQPNGLHSFGACKALRSKSAAIKVAPSPKMDLESHLCANSETHQSWQFKK